MFFIRKTIFHYKQEVKGSKPVLALRIFYWSNRKRFILSSRKFDNTVLLLLVLHCIHCNWSLVVTKFCYEKLTWNIGILYLLFDSPYVALFNLFPKSNFIAAFVRFYFRGEKSFAQTTLDQTSNTLLKCKRWLPHIAFWKFSVLFLISRIFVFSTFHF